MEENKYTYPGAKISLNENDMKWIRENIVYGEVFYEGMNPRTPIYLEDKKYYFNSSRQFHKEFHDAFNLKITTTFDELVIDSLRIEVAFRPPTSLLRKKKLNRILNGTTTTFQKFHV